MVDLFMKNEIEKKKDVIQSRSCASKNIRKTTDSFKCSQCQEILPSLDEKKKHEKFYHYLTKPFNCECGQQFGKLSEVNYHIRRVHNNEKNYVCHICKKAFFKNSDLAIHKSVHESVGKFMCKDCGRRFKHVSNLIRHSRTHTGIKPYLCLPCDKRFSQVAALRQHETTEKHKENINNDHKIIKDNPSSNQMKNESMQYCSENDGKCKVQSDNEKRKWWFYCKICGERFPFSVLLRDHETKHIANKDIKCNSCKVEFTSMQEFNIHACWYSSKLNSVKKTSDQDVLQNQIIQSKENFKVKPSETDIHARNGELTGDGDKRVELTLTQNGQIMLDNDEVLLTLNDRVYGLLLINNDVTVVDNDDYFHMFNNGKSQEAFDVTSELMELENVLNLEHFSYDMREMNVDATENQMGVVPCVSNDPEQCAIKTNATDTDAAVENEHCDSRINKEEKRNNSSDDAAKLSKSKKLRHVGCAKQNVQRHKCNECKRMFFWNSSLRNHVKKKHGKKIEYPCLNCGKIYFSSLLLKHHIKRDHFNIRSHKCIVCEKSFFRKYDLKVHSRIHTDDRPYTCKVCGKRFRHLSHSIRHDRIHQKGKVS